MAQKVKIQVLNPTNQINIAALESQQVQITTAANESTSVQVSPFVYLKGMSGKSPYINTSTNTWFAYNDTTGSYYDTQVPVNSSTASFSFLHIDCGTSTKNIDQG